MLFTTPTQFAVLLLLLIVGWLFGFASHPGGKKWKQAYRDEQAARAKDLAERDETIRQLEVRNAELTAERDKRGVAAPVAAGVAAAAVSDTATSTDKKRGWFDWGRGDDLTRLRGVDDELARLLNAEGIDSYASLAAVSDADEIALERRIDLPAGFIQRERLREQARLLADGQANEHARVFG